MSSCLSGPAHFNCTAYLNLDCNIVIRWTGDQHYATRGLPGSTTGSLTADHARLLVLFLPTFVFIAYKNKERTLEIITQVRQENGPYLPKQ